MLFGLIVLGAGVRLGNAGLACPDWPRCYGQWIPPFNFQIFLEWFHRLIAMMVGLLALVIAIAVLLKKSLRKKIGGWLLCSLGLFAFQAFLGRQTVISLLGPDTVMMHLMGGYILFALNLYIFHRLKNFYLPPAPSLQRRGLYLRWLFPLLALLVFLQATLGASVSSHYAGLACPDFPTCLGQWWPPLIGVVGIHFVHRLGAFVLLFCILGTFFYSYGYVKNKTLHKLLTLSLFFAFLQIGLGISMIFTQLHPLVSLSHSATALALFTVLVLGIIHVYRGKTA